MEERVHQKALSSAVGAASHGPQVRIWIQIGGRSPPAQKRVSSAPFYWGDRIISKNGRKRNLTAIDSLIAQFAEIAEATAVEHPRKRQRSNPSIIFADQRVDLTKRFLELSVSLPIRWQN
jgi:hypothetical protein